MHALLFTNTHTFTTWINIIPKFIQSLIKDKYSLDVLPPCDMTDFFYSWDNADCVFIYYYCSYYVYITVGDWAALFSGLHLLATFALN